MGACRANELHAMNIDDVQDLGSAILVAVPISKTKIIRKFTITDSFYNVYRKYADLRPPNAICRSLFLNYQNGKCTIQRIGINKFGSMGKQIAMYLKLPNPEQYTGHSLRRSSPTKYVDPAPHIIAMKAGKSANEVQENKLSILQGNSFIQNNPYLQRSTQFENNSYSSSNSVNNSIIERSYSPQDMNISSIIQNQTTYNSSPQQNETQPFEEVKVEPPEDLSDGEAPSDGRHIDISVGKPNPIGDANKKQFKSVIKNTTINRESFNFDSMPTLNISNCTNITINVYKCECDKSKN